jgi:hypothetical protein
MAPGSAAGEHKNEMGNQNPNHQATQKTQWYQGLAIQANADAASNGNKGRNNKGHKTTPNQGHSIGGIATGRISGTAF